MYNGQTVFSQIMDHLPMYEFRKCIDRYSGNYRTRSFSCLDQFLCMAFAQLFHRESLRDIKVCLRSRQLLLYHLGIRGKISRSTLADANEKRDWRIYAVFLPNPDVKSSPTLCRRLVLNFKILSMHWTPQQSIFVFPSFSGRLTAKVRQPLSCAHLWICAGAFRHLSKSPIT